MSLRRLRGGWDVMQQSRNLFRGISHHTKYGDKEKTSPQTPGHYGHSQHKGIGESVPSQRPQAPEQQGDQEVWSPG